MSANTTAVKETIKRLGIEVPSWAYGNSGTRFKVFSQLGVPRDPYEKIADAAQVNKFTGAVPTVALHIPWDKVKDYAHFAAYAKDLGVTLGTINSNTFQDDQYKLGSVCNPDPKVRKMAVNHLLECIDIMDITGTNDLKIWLADGTNYPGQDDLRDRQDRLQESLEITYKRLGPNQRMLLEYKFFEPSFYSTDVPDWGTSYSHCLKLGPKAMVCVDTGHHAPGTNIEFIVALLMREGRLGAFDFNSRFYADDDLIVGAADPYQLFRIMHEVNRAGGFDVGTPVSYVLDQCHNIEDKIPGQIRSITNVQEAVAKALLVDRVALKKAQLEGNVLAANDVLMDAYNTDVRPLLGEMRNEIGLDADPMKAYLASGYGAKIAAERVGGAQAGWGA
ncbi:L-rhamnose isomerase [Actinomycetes bacterium]|nr:L-rhamnose isomerase [Actinomycetes bacterium]